MIFLGVTMRGVSRRGYARELQKGFSADWLAFVSEASPLIVSESRWLTELLLENTDLLSELLDHQRLLSIHPPPTQTRSNVSEFTTKGSLDESRTGNPSPILCRESILHMMFFSKDFRHVWVLGQYGLKTEAPGPWEVFDLSRDDAEAKDSSQHHADLLRKAEELLGREFADNPLFPVLIPGENLVAP